jgi:hypothetical protein
LAAPFALALGLTFIAACVAFALSGCPTYSRRYVCLFFGLLHGIFQLTLGIAICWIVARVVGPGTAAYPLPFILLAGLLVFVANGTLFGLYLLATNMIATMHEQEVFSCQALERFKSFLRIHISAQGVTVYPVGLRKTQKRWRFAPGVTKQSSKRSPDTSLSQVLSVPENATRLFDPATPLAPELIEDPFRIG